MQQFLSVLDRNLMTNTMTKKGDSANTILEAMWQKEFFRVASQMLRQNSTISVEVTRGTIGGQSFNIDGRVDFYINGDRQWAVEFLIRGELKSQGITDAEEHAARFEGKYKQLPCKQKLVVDFRPSRYASYDDFQMTLLPGVPPKPIFLKNYWIVVYDSDKYEWLQITKYGPDARYLEAVRLKLV